MLLLAVLILSSVIDVPDSCCFARVDLVAKHWELLLVLIPCGVGLQVFIAACIALPMVVMYNTLLLMMMPRHLLVMPTILRLMAMTNPVVILRVA